MHQQIIKPASLTLRLTALSGSYSGDHYGEVIWARKLYENSSVRDKYYNGNGKKLTLAFLLRLLIY